MRHTTALPMLSLAVLTMLAQGGCWGSGDEKFVGSSELKVAKTASAPSTDPRSALWNGAQETKVALMPQSIVYPLLGKQSVTSLRVRALLDDQWLAVRLEWDDRQRDDKLEVDKFTDAIAIEMPIREPQKTNPMMGSAEYPVYILHWKAAWQKDVDVGHHADVQEYHPGYWADPYPFVEGRYPYDVSESFQSDNARRYFAATSAGNPIAKLYRKWPVEELHAEGFGSLADHNFQDAQGKGVWENGKWSVVVSVPRQTADKENPSLASGMTTAMAFALWDGSNQNVGGRKHWASFVKVVLP